MADILRGRVIRVIDGDTFAVRLTWKHPKNEYTRYPLDIRMRLRRGNAPERGMPGFDAARRDLARQIERKRVEVKVYTYDRATDRDIVRVWPLDRRGHRQEEVVAWGRGSASRVDAAGSGRVHLPVIAGGAVLAGVVAYVVRCR